MCKKGREKNDKKEYNKGSEKIFIKVIFNFNHKYK